VASNAPDDMRTLVALARVQLANNDAPGARTTLTNATRLAAFDAPVQTEIALLQMAARNLPGAAYSLEKALQADPEHLPAQVLLTEVDTRQGEFAKAEALAQQIIKKQPKQAIGHSLLGDLAMARRQPAAAIDAYRKAFQVQPSTETLLRLFGVLAGQDAKAAIALAEQWLKSHPNDAPARRMLAEAHVRSGNMAGARQELERLRQQAPKDAGVLNDLANVLLRLNDPQAQAVAEQALAAEPGNAAVIDTAGWIALNAGNLDRALQLLRDARLRNPDSAEVRYHLAAALLKAGRRSEAREELQAALAGNRGFDGRAAAEQLLQTLK
jgi:putative PEP-CTERM system TPR-repeat lipoprotein